MEERMTLTELQLLIRDSLFMALPDWYWVIAEISELKENNAGHCYLELIEKLPGDKNVGARIKAVIWGKRYRFLKPLFKDVAGDYLAEGMKVLVKARVEYHEIYGLSLVITDIDPSYTIGEMALKRQMIIRRLEEEGVFTMNRELTLPVVPQRIAVISSGNAAGYTDFINHLTKNSYGYVFYTALFDTVMQGTETEESVIGSLDRIAARQDLFDVVVIIRGGGSVSDLSWFDNYRIAYHITQFPLPVITGIGHEKDLSVTDMVARLPLKTPTAVADHLIESVADAESHLEEMSNNITQSSMSILGENREKLSGSIIQLVNFGKEFIVKAGLIPATEKTRLVSITGYFKTGRNILIENYRRGLMHNTINCIGIFRKSTETLENKLKILDPVNVLGRGFTITSIDGKIIKSVETIDNDAVITTTFKDGNINSKVLNKRKKAIN